MNDLPTWWWPSPATAAAIRRDLEEFERVVASGLCTGCGRPRSEHDTIECANMEVRAWIAEHADALAAMSKRAGRARCRGCEPDAVVADMALCSRCRPTAPVPA